MHILSFRISKIKGLLGNFFIQQLLNKFLQQACQNMQVLSAEYQPSQNALQRCQLNPNSVNKVKFQKLVFER